LCDPGCRWYTLKGNFLYCYPSSKADAKVRNVLYVEGANVVRHSDPQWDSKGYFGIAIHTSSVHGDHNRYLFVRTEVDQTRWLESLRHASRTVPFEDAYRLGVRCPEPLSAATLRCPLRPCACCGCWCGHQACMRAFVWSAQTCRKSWALAASQRCTNA
jgi:hypothetical protein